MPAFKTRFNSTLPVSVEKAFNSVDKVFESVESIFDNLTDQTAHFAFPFVTVESSTDTGRNFPPYNISTLESGQTLLDIAVAGYTKERLTVEMQETTLIVREARRSSLPSRNIMSLSSMNR